jgi:hypothetical protein
MELLKKDLPGQVQWDIPVIPTLRRLSKEDFEFEANLGNIARSWLKNNFKRPAHQGRLGTGS